MWVIKNQSCELLYTVLYIRTLYKCTAPLKSTVQKGSSDLNFTVR
jgi:hypothetical protein